MSETKNLKLFKHNEPLETNENQFDIKKSLHDNWDKLDEFAGIVNTKTVEIENKQKQHDTDISNIKQEQQDQNSKIESNTTENKDNTELLSQIMGLLPSTKGEGEHVTLQDTGEARFKNFQVQGDSKQETRSGKNKIPYPYKDLSGTVIKDLGDGRLILNGTLAENTYKVIQTFELKTGKYKLLFSKTNIPNGSYVLMSGKVSGQILQGNKVDASFELTEDDTVTLGISILKGTYNQAPLDLMILEATEQDETFEQYGASPSPEFPSKIRNVGDNVNFFNKDGNYVEGSAKFEKIETGIKVTVQSAGNYRYIWVDLGGKELLGKTLTMSSNIYANAQNAPKVIIYAGTKESPSKNIIKGAELSKSIQTAIFQMPDTFPEGTDSFRVYLYGNFTATSQVGDYVEYRDFKIEEGVHATSYSPYNCGNAEITVGNKNLANTKIIKNTNIITVNEDGSLTLANNSNTAGYASTGKKLNELCKGLKVGDTAYLKLITTSTNNIYLQGKANQYWLGNNSNKITKDMLEDTVIVYGGYNKTDKLQIQITKINSKEYTKHEEQLVNFPFSEGQRLYKGDYLAEDGIHHVRKQSIVSIGSIVTLSNGNIGGIYYPPQKASKPNNSLVSSKAVFVDGRTTLENTVYENVSNVVFIGNSTDTLETIKQKYDGSILEYELNKEEIESYTPEQQEAYDKLKKMHSYNEQTNIFSKDEISPVFNVEAIKNLNATFAQLSATMLERS